MKYCIHDLHHIQVILSILQTFFFQDPIKGFLLFGIRYVIDTIYYEITYDAKVMAQNVDPYIYF
jgi:hypothetical protein